MTTQFWSRSEGGMKLGLELGRFKGTPGLVALALPRGGVPVAYEVARALGAPLDVLVVRKVGLPGSPELAMGAVASGGVRVLYSELIHEFGVPHSLVEHVIFAELDEVTRREHAYRGWVAPVDLRGRTVILVDDGLATGATMRAAIIAAQQRGAASVVVAAPVGAAQTCQMLLAHADEVVCLTTPVPFGSVGAYYNEFPQLTDDDVRDILDRARRSETAATAPAELAVAGAW